VPQDRVATEQTSDPAAKGGLTLGRAIEIEDGLGEPPTEQERAEFERMAGWWKAKVAPQLERHLLRRHVPSAGRIDPLPQRRQSGTRSREPRARARSRQASRSRTRQASRDGPDDDPAPGRAGLPELRSASRSELEPEGVESGHNEKRPGSAETLRGRHQEVSPDATPTLQALALAARIQREAVKNKAYRATPLGLEAARYYRWKKNEWGATAETLRDYEAILAKLALDHADLELADFAPPVGTERLREFVDHRWGDRTPRTRAKVISVLRDFFAWAVREGKLAGNPATPIFRPRKREVARGTFTPRDAAKAIASQPRLRDRVALLLLFRLGLRKSELARVQFKHYDGRHLTVFGKGGKVRYLPVVANDLRSSLEQHILERQAEPDEYLLYPEKLGPEFYGGPVGTIWENRRKQLSSPAMHRWWAKCLDRAGIPHRPMHEARHTAITEFLRRTGNLKLAQMLAGHADIGTTANIYAHLDTSDLESALRALNQETT
jgi:integrase/recombinase XerD